MTKVGRCFQLKPVFFFARIACAILEQDFDRVRIVGLDGRVEDRAAVQVAAEVDLSTEFLPVQKRKKLDLPSIQIPLKPIAFSVIFVFEENKNKKRTVGNGFGSVGRTVASDTRGPRFESSHRQIFMYNI